MRHIYHTLGLLLCTLVLATSCLEETIPTDAVTEAQKDKAHNIPAMMQALPARFHAMGSAHYAFGYGAMMHIRDVQTGDLTVADSNYDQFLAWERNVNVGANSAFMQYVWNYYYQSILACNSLFAVLPTDSLSRTPIETGAKAAAHAFRALFYLDLARAYEFLPNEVFPDSTNVEGRNLAWLTVPIVTEHTTEMMARNNPRATRTEMFAFIKDDLDSAQVMIKALDTDPTYAYDPTMPHSFSVLGLLARLYMWVEDYQNAYDAAVEAQRLAMAVGLTPMITSNTIYSMSDDGGAPFTGFNTPTSFMWADVQTSDNATVTSGICNWTSWMCPLTSYGYAGAGAVSCIDMNLYKRIDINDWRRGLFVVDNMFYPDGMAVKFAPGGFDYNNPLVSAASSYPIMRLEEMALIAVEAQAHLNPRRGIAALVDYMEEFCGVLGYTYKGGSSPDALYEEIIAQKRIEFWGEGISFFDIKRLNLSVTRGYTGTNFPPLTRFNTNGRPAWMNWAIVLTEENGNALVRDNNNPNPSDKYTVWTEPAPASGTPAPAGKQLSIGTIRKAGL